MFHNWQNESLFQLGNGFVHATISNYRKDTDHHQIIRLSKENTYKKNPFLKSNSLLFWLLLLKINFKLIELFSTLQKKNVTCSSCIFSTNLKMLQIPSPMFHKCLWSCVNKPFRLLFQFISLVSLQLENYVSLFMPSA